MGMFLNKFRKKDGSLTVEAAIILPFFIMIILTIAFFIRVVHTQNIVQYAINQTANELSTYSYIYSATGVQKLHDDTKTTLDEGENVFNNYASEITSSFEALNSSKPEIEANAEKLANGDLNNIDSIETLLQTINEKKEAGEVLVDELGNAKAEVVNLKNTLTEISKDPKAALMSVGCVLANGAFEEVKTYLATPIIKTLIRKHFKTVSESDENKRLLNLHVDGGFEGLDFSESSIFKDKQSIDIIVRYKIKTFLFLPDVYIIQRAKVRAWLDGNGSRVEPKEETETTEVATSSVWDMNSFTDRGKEIQKLEGRNLPDNFPVITKHDGSGNVEKVISINLDDSTYQKPSNVKSKILSAARDLSSFNGAEHAGTVISGEDIKSKKLVVIVPEGTVSEELAAVLEDLKKNNEESLGITIEIKEAYGRETESEEK